MAENHLILNGLVLGGPTNYLSLGFPNLFLLVVLGQILGLPDLTSFAAWLLAPMFLLDLLDVWVCRRFAAKGADDWTLQGYLCLGPDGRLSECRPLAFEE